MNNTKIAVIGHGYVGLPLAGLFATQYPVVGLDISERRVAGLNSSTDSTLEISDKLLQNELVKNNPSLKEYGQGIDIYDPWANPEEVMHKYGITSKQQLSAEQQDAIVLTVAHKDFLDINLNSVKDEQSFAYDMNGVLEKMDVRL